MRPHFGYCLEPISLAAVLLYGLNRFWIKPSALLGDVSFFSDHFNDVLCFPIFLPAVLLVHRGLGLRKDDVPPTTTEIGIHFLIWSAYFEGIAPAMPTTYRTVADPLDVAAYALGALIGGLCWGTWRNRVPNYHNASLNASPLSARRSAFLQQSGVALLTD